MCREPDAGVHLLAARKGELALIHHKALAVQRVKTPMHAQGAKQFKVGPVLHHVQVAVQLHLHLVGAYPCVARNVHAQAAGETFHQGTHHYAVGLHRECVGHHHLSRRVFEGGYQQGLVNALMFLCQPHDGIQVKARLGDGDVAPKGGLFPVHLHKHIGIHQQVKIAVPERLKVVGP